MGYLEIVIVVLIFVVLVAVVLAIGAKVRGYLGRGEVNILFVTGNKNKRIEAEKILGVNLDNKAIDLPEIQSIDVREVIKAKLAEAYSIEKNPVIVEDTGLYIEDILADNKLVKLDKPFPGALVRYYMDAINLDLLAKVHGGANAYAETIVGYHDGHETRYFEGKVSGKIADKPRGDNGFGWDKIFIPDGHMQTFAEMTADKKNSMSMRRLAFDKLAQHLRQ